MRPLLLDLFCAAGGAAMGYHRAGFEIVGVDIEPQPHYPFAFVRGDALAPPVDLSRFDAIHASPPCQAYSEATSTGRARHPALIEPVRDLLGASGRPGVIENVPPAPLTGPILCGSMFGLVAGDLELRRHRRFEAIGWEWPALMTPCGHGQRRRVAGVYGGGGEDRRGKRNGGGFTPDAETRRVLMGMPWASGQEVGEAIPPAYTEWVGRLLLAELG